MSSSCLNCGTPLHGHFCSNCGQKADTHRINAHFLLHELQHGLFHVDKGILFTLKELFTRPGHAIREYLEGKRKRHFSPLMLVLILAPLLGFLTIKVNHNEGLITVRPNSEVQTADSTKNTERLSYIERNLSKPEAKGQQIGEWLNAHYAWTLLMLIPITALCSWLVFRKSGYNLAEWMVVATFIMGQFIVISIVFQLFYWVGIFKSNGIATVSMLIAGCWSLYQLMAAKGRSFGGVLWRVLVIFFFSFTLLALLVTLGLVIFKSVSP